MWLIIKKNSDNITESAYLRIICILINYSLVASVESNMWYFKFKEDTSIGVKVMLQQRDLPLKINIKSNDFLICFPTEDSGLVDLNHLSRKMTAVASLTCPGCGRPHSCKGHQSYRSRSDFLVTVFNPPELPFCQNILSRRFGPEF